MSKAFRTGWSVVKGESDDFSSVMPTWKKNIARQRELGQRFPDLAEDIEHWIPQDIEDSAMDFAEPAVNDALESIDEKARSKDMPMPMRRTLTGHNTNRRVGI